MKCPHAHSIVGIPFRQSMPTQVTLGLCHTTILQIDCNVVTHLPPGEYNYHTVTVSGLLTILQQDS